MTISLRLDPVTTRRLALLARARGISKSQLIRDCLKNYLADEDARPTAWQLGKDLFGCQRSGESDRSVRAADIARDKAHDKISRKNRRR